MKKALSLLALFVLGAGAGLVYVTTTRRAAPPATPAQATPAALCAPHGVPPSKCPWCDETLIERLGACGGHGVPEALCSRCNAFLIPGFRAAGDWCAGHDLPESQCATCRGLNPRGPDPQPTTSPAAGHNTGPDGAFCGFHQIAEASCPWCDTSLIERLGHCRGHDVPEALCSRCNPALIPGFKAEGDWCAGHDLPESQCLACRGEEKTQ